MWEGWGGVGRGGEFWVRCAYAQSHAQRARCDAMIRVPHGNADSTAACTLLVRLELVCVMQLECLDRGDHREFRYVF